MVTHERGPLAHLTDLKDRTVLVTGHSGFIGSWLSAMLVAAGARVVGYSTSDDPVTSARAEWLSRRLVRTVRGDVRDLPALLTTIVDCQPDLLVHLAAQSILGRGFAEAHLTFDVNLNGSLSVLEAARTGAVPALIHTTSDKCYAPADAISQPMSESSPLGGTGPYPASKAIAETLYREFAPLMPASASIASVRLGNVMGGGDEADRLVPNALRSFRCGKPFRPRDPAAMRPFQHVLDVAFGMTRLAAGLLNRQVDSGQALNFAPPAAGSSSGDLVAHLARAWGTDAVVGGPVEDADFPEQQVIKLDGSKAAAILDWQHQLNLGDAASWTVAWTRMTDGGRGPADATARQVTTYLESLTHDHP